MVNNLSKCGCLYTDYPLSSRVHFFSKYDCIIESDEWSSQPRKLALATFLNMDFKIKKNTSYFDSIFNLCDLLVIFSYFI